METIIKNKRYIKMETIIKNKVLFYTGTSFSLVDDDGEYECFTDIVNATDEQCEFAYYNQ